MLNIIAVEGVLLIGLTMVLVRRMREEFGQAAVLVIAVIGFAWLNFETLRAVDCMAGRLADVATAKVVALSVLWAMIGLAAVLIGFARQLKVLRYAALSLLAVTLVKILFVDLAEVRPVYRILSFLAVGAMLLCVSFVYHRHSQAQRQT